MMHVPSSEAEKRGLELLATVLVPDPDPEPSSFHTSYQALIFINKQVVQKAFANFCLFFQDLYLLGGPALSTGTKQISNTTLENQMQDHTSPM